MKRYQDYAVLLLRIALATGFLSAVSSRLGFWGSYSSGWESFLNYTEKVNSFAPKNFILPIAITATIAESVLGLLLFIGYQTKYVSIAAALLTFLFALAMTYSFGVKDPLDYSVFVFSMAAFLLSTMEKYRWSLDEIISKNKNKLNINKMEKQITKSSEIDWKPLTEEGIKTDGIYIKFLRFDAVTKRPPSFLLKFDAGASYPNHIHPAGEEIYVLEGEVRSGKDELKAGDYLYMPPGSSHSVFSRTGCTLLFNVPEEVVILK